MCVEGHRDEMPFVDFRFYLTLLFLATPLENWTGDRHGLCVYATFVVCYHGSVGYRTLSSGFAQQRRRFGSLRCCVSCVSLVVVV